MRHFWPREVYLKQWAKSQQAHRHVRRYKIAPEWRQPGEEHLCVWTGGELAELLRSLGLVPQIQEPQFHGRRVWRDTRVIGIKP